ncbi:hypothetical protein DICA3_B07514 [Diutina catenulata]
MKFAYLIAASGFALASPIDTTDDYHRTFGLRTESNDRRVDNVPVWKVSDPHAYRLGGKRGSYQRFTWHENDTIQDYSELGIYVDPESYEFTNVDPWGLQQPTPNFSIRDGYLCLKGNCNWLACPLGSGNWTVTSSESNCEGGVAVKMFVFFPDSCLKRCPNDTQM